MTPRRNGLVSLALAVTVLVACGEESSPTVSVQGTAPSAPSSSSPASLGVTTSVATEPAGRTIDTPLGRVTVGVVTDLATGTPPRTARVVEIEVCSSHGVPFSAASFLLQTEDGRSWSPSPPSAAARQPDLASVVEPNPSPGSCARGWLTYDVDSAQRSKGVLFHPQRSDETFTWSAR